MPSKIVLTFDNLGEAAALERGTWDGGTPLGEDPSVTVALPCLLDELDACDLRATFFVEAINCELNPGALREIVARGHELGAHGWRHEPWTDLDDEREMRLLTRAAAAYADLGLVVDGFRPPGGELRSSTPTRLRDLGYRWSSAEGGDPGVRSGLAEVPFDWELVDAYHLMDRFADLRRERGDPTAPRSPTETGRRLRAGLTGRSPTRMIVMHPFLMLQDAWWDEVRLTLRAVAELVRGGRARCETAGAQAASLLAEAR